MSKITFQFFLNLLVIFFPLVVCGQLPLRLDDNRELFVDHYLIDRLDQIELKMHTPRNEGVAFYFDKPWEGAYCAYFTIIHDRGKYRAYYRGQRGYGRDGNRLEVTCYAESDDGIQWKKPDLKLHDIDGMLENNVILAKDAPVMHNFSPFVDKNPNVKAEERYKALGGLSKTGLFAYTSKDGIRWRKLKEEAVITGGKYDSQNVAFWSEAEQKYVSYVRRMSGEDGFTGVRSVGRTTSHDFINWSETLAMNFGDTPLEQLYTQQTSPYYRAPHIYMAIGGRFMPGRYAVKEEEARRFTSNPNYYKDCSDVFFMTTRGGNIYDRTFMESFIRPGIGLQNWLSRSNYPALNVVQTSDTEMSVYVNEEYGQATAHLKRYSLRIDGFTSLHAKYKGGEMLTKPFIFKGAELEINYSTSAAGGIKVEIQDVHGNPVPGYTLSDCKEIIGNEIKRIVTWKEEDKVSSLAGKPVRLRVFLRDADLYSIKFN